MTYVVHEGLVDLDIQDPKLNAVRASCDMDKLRRFRNATFHVQDRYGPEKMNAHINDDGFGWPHELWKEQDRVVLEMLTVARRYGRPGDIQV